MHKGVDFCISLPTLVVICLFDYNQLSGCEVVSYRGFDFHSLGGYDFEHLFLCQGAYVYLFWRTVYLDPLPCFKLDF